MKATILLAACLLLGGCGNGGLYPGLKMGSCAPNDTTHHTVYDFGGIPECVPGGVATQSASHWID
jgi:hypothetical protein